MSEETNNNEGSWSGLKKTIIATLTTIITGGGVWISTKLFGGGSDDSGETKTEQVAPATQQAAPVVINLTQTQENTQQQKTGGTNTIIKEVEKPVEKKTEKKVEKEEDPW